jgi:putative addiction module component (TIGR02574 family)
MISREEYLKLPLEERLQLVQDIWDSIAATQDDFPVPDWHKEELDRRLAVYRSVAQPRDPAGTTAIVVDDGLATGSTAMAAVDVLRHRGAREVWVAVPVAPRDTTERLAEMVDRVVVLHQPRRFLAVGAWYRDFSQTSDDEVRRLLSELR